MGNIFKKPQKLRLTEKDKAILELKTQRDSLKNYQLRLSQKQAQGKQKVREFMKNNNLERAKFFLRKKIYLDKLTLQADTQIEALENMIEKLDFSEIQIKVIDGLKNGSECLKKLQQSIDLDLVEDILETTQEAIEKNNEINQMLFGMMEPQDEDDIEKELNDLIALKAPEDIVNLPKVPTKHIESTDKILISS
uniref:Charged multivesicular body protein 6 (Trinotate prediction) n=1 Tax=Henneguya salminicola TaxID=69463 RepID=A0A6G3MH22_HENSL